MKTLTQFLVTGIALLGLGAAGKVDLVEIHWPGPAKTIQRLTNLPVDRYITVIEQS